MERYVHGYSAREMSRLRDQADTLAELLHHDTRYPAGWSRARGGLRRRLADGHAGREQPRRAVHRGRHQSGVARRGRNGECASGDLTNVAFQQADLLDPPFAAGLVRPRLRLLRARTPARADAGPAPAADAARARRNDHGDRRRPRFGVLFAAERPAPMRAVACQITLQARAGGDACIGRRLYPLLVEADFADVHVSPRMVYVDDSRPRWSRASRGTRSPR